MNDHLKSVSFKHGMPNEVRKELKTTSVERIKVEINLAVVKNPSANWIIAAWNELEKDLKLSLMAFTRLGS